MLNREIQPCSQDTGYGRLHFVGAVILGLVQRERWDHVVLHFRMQRQSGIVGLRYFTHAAPDFPDPEKSE